MSSPKQAHMHSCFTCQDMATAHMPLAVFIMTAYVMCDAYVCVGVQLNLSPGHKGLNKLLGGIPSWVTFQDKEKVEVGALSLSCIAHASALCMHKMPSFSLTSGICRFSL